MVSQKPVIDLPSSWLEQLAAEFDLDYMQKLKAFLVNEKQQGKIIYPRGKDIFRAFNSTDFDRVKVVILGQDPYHGSNQAHGLSFSVPREARIPPSLQNIYKEIEADLGIPVPGHGHLQPWAEQGVLLLNSVLTVEHQMAASHRNRGWEQFTDRVVQQLAAERKHLVFMLWGSYAQAKGGQIDEGSHCILKAPHPSPLSAHRGFLGCRHFSQANAYLEKHGLNGIDWRVE